MQKWIINGGTENITGWAMALGPGAEHGKSCLCSTSTTILEQFKHFLSNFFLNLEIIFHRPVGIYRSPVAIYITKVMMVILVKQ